MKNKIILVALNADFNVCYENLVLKLSNYLWQGVKTVK